MADVDVLKHVPVDGERRREQLSIPGQIEAYRRQQCQEMGALPCVG